MFCPVSSHSRLVDWMWRYSVSADVAAVVLGVSRRTVYRWLATGRAPVLVAHCLDQIYDGPWIGCSLRRGTWHACRDNEVRRLVRSVMDAGSVRYAHRASPGFASLQPAAPAKPSKSLAVPPSRRPGIDPRTPPVVGVSNRCLSSENNAVLAASSTVRRPARRSPVSIPISSSTRRRSISEPTDEALRSVLDPAATPRSEEVQKALTSRASDRRVGHE